MKPSEPEADITPRVRKRYADSISKGDEIWYRLRDEHYVHYAVVERVRQDTIAVKRMRNKSRSIARTTSSTRWLDRDLIKIIDHEPNDS